VAEYMGGKSSPSRRFDVLVSTPQAFLILQQVEAEKKLFAWSNFFACVFDECHHIIKDHPYRVIAQGINAWQSHYNNRIQILGLSASLTYAVGHKAVEAALGNLCYDLSVTNMISPTEEELMSAGYTPKDDVIEQMHEPWNVPDGVVPEHLRKTHAMYETFMGRVKHGTNTPFATKIYKVVREIEEQIDELQDGRKGEFRSPLNQIKLAAWEEYAFQMSRKSSKGSPRQNLYDLLEIWYVALRMVVQSWEEEEQLVLQWLLINSGFHNEGWFSYNLTISLESVERLLSSDAHTIKSQKISSLRMILTDKKKAKGVDFRGIIFVQQRITAYVLCQYLNKNDDFFTKHGIRAEYVTARNSKITPSIKMTPSEATRRIEKFRKGDINVIVATSVIEEGLDVPEANVVISYDCLKDTVELAQRFGRARQKESSLTLMTERRDRPLAVLKDAKKLQDNIIKEFDPVQTQKTLMSRQQSQLDRERAAAPLLANRAKIERSPLESLNIYAAKTKAVLKTESLDQSQDGRFRCKLEYVAMSRRMDGLGVGATKKQCKHEAALCILKKLRDSDERRGH